jgi:peptidoglycan/LPS O-acetylase OafA/YrhL
MDPLSPIPAVLAIFSALFTCFVLVKKFGSPDDFGRFVAIDGLRGYLAFFVFLHHSAVWFFYLRTGEWKVPPSNLYTHFGQTGVAFFFMITGFLFFSKILEGRNKKIDWLRLYVSRFLRLMPLYSLVMLALLVIVLILSEGTVREPISVIVIELSRWMSFTMFGDPDINSVEKTWMIIAGVSWSLPYEWMFYFILPLFALVVGARVTWPFLILSGLALILVFSRSSLIYHWLSFSGGILAAFVVRSDYVCQKFRMGIFSLAVIVFIFITVYFYPSAYGATQILLLSAAFVIVASGNSLFGLLANKYSRTLGEMAYSIYLLHGILLFVLFRFLIGLDRAKILPPVFHWAAIIAITPVLIVVAFFCYKKIEHPALMKTNSLTFWLRKNFNSQSRVVD